MRLLLLLSCLLACRIAFAEQEATPPGDKPSTRLVIELSDGSRIIGTPSIDTFKITTEYAKLEVPLSQMHEVEFTSGTNRVAQVSLQNGDILSGRFEITKIAVKTVFGQAAIPLDKINKIRVGHVDTGETLPDGLVFHYTFNADENGVVTDTSGSGNDGKVKGATYVAEDKAMSFNGDRQAVIAKNPANLQLQDFTIVAWIKRGSLEKASGTWQDGAIFAWGHGGYGLAIRSDGTLFLSQVMGGTDIYAACAVNDQALHQVAVTKQGSKVVFYLDGTVYPAADEYSGSFEFGSNAIAVGAVPDDNQEAGFMGEIREVAVFSRPLSDEEIKGVYESQR